MNCAVRKILAVFLIMEKGMRLWWRLPRNGWNKWGFAALGLDTFAVQTREEAAEKLHQLAQGGYGIIYITEKLAAELTHEIEKYQEQVTPAIIQIPGIAGNTGAGVAGVKKSVEQAVGSDIIFGS